MRPTLRNGLVLVGDVVILAGGRLAHEAVKGLTAGPKAASPTWVEFIGSVEEFKGGARPELARQAHDLFLEQKWGELQALFKGHNINGGYPPNDGFISTKTVTLEPGTTFDRFGGYRTPKGEFKDGGKFVAPDDVPFEGRALPESALGKERHKYEVLKPIPDVKEGKAIPWFEQPGKGKQYKLEDSIDDLKEAGYIKEIK